MPPVLSILVGLEACVGHSLRRVGVSASEVSTVLCRQREKSCLSDCVWEARELSLRGLDNAPSSRWEIVDVGRQPRPLATQ